MRLPAVVTAAVWATSVAGFYPFHPDLDCAVNGCPRRTEVRERGDATSFKLVKRGFKSNLDPETRLANLVERLKIKYNNRGATLAARENDYSIDFSDQPTQPTSAALDQDGTDYSYFAQIAFGSGDKELFILMDTGASSTWVMSSTCDSSACAVHNTFGPADSSSLVMSSTPFSITYGSGTVSGLLGTDSLAFAGLNFTMTFGLANETSNDFLNFPIDGIMGLSLVQGKYPTAMQVISDDDLLEANIFGINLSRAKDNTHDGEINFGSPDTSKYEGDLDYSPTTTSSGQWAIKLDDVGANGGTAGLQGPQAYIDSGTSYIFAPPDDAQALHDLIPGSQLSSNGATWQVPCDTTMPIQLIFNDVTYNVSSEDWVGDQAGDLCTSNIYPQDVIGDGTSWLCGDTFLKNVYAVFDADQMRIGFGVKKTSTASASATATTASTSGGTAFSTFSTTLSVTPSSTSSTPMSTSYSSTGSSGSSSDSITVSRESLSNTVMTVTATQTSPGLGPESSNTAEAHTTTATAVAESETSTTASPTSTKASSGLVAVTLSHTLLISAISLTAFLIPRI